MRSKKVVIIGGGIAGLSAAFLLTYVPNIEIIIYERESTFGGQARSMKSEKCYIEYSWRIFAQTYNNLHFIINEIGARDNFRLIEKSCVINNSDINYEELSVTHLLHLIVKYGSIKTVIKIAELFCMSKERVFNEYDNINALEYFDNNIIIKVIIGPFLGLDAMKVSLSGLMKNIYSLFGQKIDYDFIPKTRVLSKYPTQESLFKPWIEYLKRKGVKMITNTEIDNIKLDINKDIDTIYTKNNEIIKADAYIFSCSLQSIINIMETNKNLKSYKITNNLNKLRDNLQLYFTMNFYFNMEVGDDCTEMVITEMAWLPIIQKKRTWKNNYLNNCNSKIKDVWNVGFIDNIEGISIKKKLSDCSKEEAIKEGIYQVSNSKYIKNILNRYNLTFDDIFIGIETWYEFKNDKNNKLISTNPKYSLNTGNQKYMPDVQSDELPKNMFLSGYYVNSTKGGASMEASCETGLNAAVKSLEYLSINVPFKPFTYDTSYTIPICIPLTSIDSIIYKFNGPPITRLILYIILIIIIYKLMKNNFVDIELIPQTFKTLIKKL